MDGDVRTMEKTLVYTWTELRQIGSLQRKLHGSISGLWLTLLLPMFVVLICAALLVWSESFRAMPSFALTSLCWIGYFAFSLGRRLRQHRKRETTLYLDEGSRGVRFSNTREHISWHAYDDFHETDDFLVVSIHGHCECIPKRLFTGEELDEVRQWCSKAGTNPDNPAANRLYDIVAEYPSAHEYVVREGDTEKSRRQTFIDVDSQEIVISKRRRYSAHFFNLIMVCVCLYWLSVVGIDHSLFGVLAGTAPMLVLLFVPYLLKKINAVPAPFEFKSQVRLMENGIALGNREIVFVCPWGDFQMLTRSPDFLAIDTALGRQIIPRGSFGSLDALDSFCDAVRMHHDRAASLPQEKPVLRETGNPYQAPQG